MKRKKTFLVVALCIASLMLMGANGYFGSNTTPVDYTFPDDISAIFGTSSDFCLEYDSSNGYLQLGDCTNDFLRVTDAGTTGTFEWIGAATFTGGVTAASMITSPSATPQMIFKDSDASAGGDDNVYFTVNCTDAGDTTEDCDITMYQQIAGNPTAIMTSDADGVITWGLAHDLGALELVTTGDIMGGINVSSKAGAYTVGADDAHEDMGTMFTNSNVADITLKGTTAVVGASGCLMQEAGITGIMQLEPGTGSHLVYEGVEMTDGTPLASAGAATDRICWVGISSDHWLITASTGTWAE